MNGLLANLAFRLFFCLFFLLAVLSFDAQAYIDPGSGSILLQLILGGLAGIGVVVKLYWGRIKEKFIGGPRETHE